MKAEDLQKLAVQLPNLIELGFIPDKELTRNDLVDFFQHNPKLEKLFLTVSPSKFTDDFNNEINKEFNVRKYVDVGGWGVITLEHKQLD